MSKPSVVSANQADPLGEILHMLRLTGTLYCRAELTAPWGLDVPAMEDSMMFLVVVSGSGWLSVDGNEPTLVSAGSLALVPHGAGHAIASEPGGGGPSRCSTFRWSQLASAMRSCATGEGER